MIKDFEIYGTKYSTDYKYAKDISFKMTCDAISTLLTKMYSKVTV